MSVRTLLLLLCILPGVLAGQHAHEEEAISEGPEIGIIDFYGRYATSEEEIRRELGVTEGSQLPRSKNKTELLIERIPKVVRTQLQAVCCDEGKAILYVGIEEEGAPHFDYRHPPEDPVLLPEEIHSTYVMFLSSLNQAVRDNETQEDMTQGHSLMENAAARSQQEQFIEQAGEHLPVIRDVLRNSMNEEHRAIAAYVIGYAADKTKVVDDLLYALRDSDDTVRDNAMRSLAAIEVLAKLRPTLGIEIPPTWLIEMLNSIIWTDRTTAAVNLVNITEWRQEEVLTQIRERALDSLLDMARWKHLPHALPSYILLGRILGLEETKIQAAWSGEDRAALIESAAALKAKKK